MTHCTVLPSYCMTQKAHQAMISDRSIGESKPLNTGIYKVSWFLLPRVDFISFIPDLFKFCNQSLGTDKFLFFYSTEFCLLFTTCEVSYCSFLLFSLVVFFCTSYFLFQIIFLLLSDVDLVLMLYFSYFGIVIYSFFLFC